MSQLLIIVAASVFLLLGGLHGVVTLKDLKNPKAFTPRDPELRKAMQQSSIAFHRTINLWDAWMGFNLTHSLGLVLIGAAFLHVGVFEPAAFAQSPLLQACAIGVSATYLILSLKFFFAQPAICSAFAMACFAIAAGLAYA